MGLFLLYVSIGALIVALTINCAVEVSNEWEAKNKRPQRPVVFYGGITFVALLWPVFCFWVIQAYLTKVINNG